MKRWLRILVFYAPGIALFVAGLVVLLTTTVATTVYVSCPIPVNPTPNYCPPITEYVINPAVPILWFAALAYTVSVSVYRYLRRPGVPAEPFHRLSA
ncbi:MAG: hypothetical protein WCB19_06895 [Thermoplasmata archaeon]